MSLALARSNHPHQSEDQVDPLDRELRTLLELQRLHREAHENDTKSKQESKKEEGEWYNGWEIGDG